MAEVHSVDSAPHGVNAAWPIMSCVHTYVCLLKCISVLFGLGHQSLGVAEPMHRAKERTPLNDVWLGLDRADPNSSASVLSTTYYVRQLGLRSEECKSCCRGDVSDASVPQLSLAPRHDVALFHLL